MLTTLSMLVNLKMLTILDNVDTYMCGHPLI